MTVAVTSGALIAAVSAARWAAESFRVSDRTYKLETSTILVQAKCRRKDHNCGSANDVLVWCLSTFRIVQGEKPDDDSTVAEYKEEPYDFVSLGRSPIVDAHVRLALESEKGGTAGTGELIEIGSLRADGEVHVRLMIHEAIFDSVRLVWLRDSATMNNRQDVLNFNPLSPYNPNPLLSEILFSSASAQTSTPPAALRNSSASALADNSNISHNQDSSESPHLHLTAAEPCSPLQGNTAAENSAKAENVADLMVSSFDTIGNAVSEGLEQTIEFARPEDGAPSES